jgi:gamma-glutamyltranspeptidase/glutathione hydrolase
LRHGPVLLERAPGGARIIGYVAQTLIAIPDWAMRPQAAIDLPHVVAIWAATELEAGTNAAALKEPLEARGHRETMRALSSGRHAIVVTARGITGGADPRRKGVALGD